MGSRYLSRLDLDCRGLIVAHDAGGAELIANFLKNQSYLQHNYLLGGPAISIFNRVLGDIKICKSSVQRAMLDVEWILTGTSWQSELEKNALLNAKQENKFSAAFLDHWVNYKERFIYRGIELQPTELWVADSHAFRLAKELWPKRPIINQGNPYLASIIKQSKFRNHSQCKEQVLIVTEPIAAHAKCQQGDEFFFGYTEHDTLKLIFARIPVISWPNEPEIILIRPHPSEQCSKYAYLKDRYPHYNLEICNDSHLLDDIANSRIIIGSNTMALVVAISLGKRAVSVIPKGAQPCVLPQTEIEHWH